MNPRFKLLPLCAVILVLFSGAAWGQNGTNASVTSSIEYLGGSESIPAGHPARFRVAVNNGGPDAATNTKVWIAWFRSGLSGTTLHDHTMRPSQGQCSRSLTPDPDCYVGMINANSSMTIDVDGQTAPGILSIYTLRVWVESDQTAKTMLAEFKQGSSVTIAESGGGSTSWLMLALLTFIAVRRRSGYRELPASRSQRAIFCHRQ